MARAFRTTYFDKAIILPSRADTLRISLTSAVLCLAVAVVGLASSYLAQP